jgi:hypothetical protein
MQVERMDTWAASLEDQPGTLATKLEALAKAGVNLEFIIARRTPEKAGSGVVFVIPIKGAAAARAAKAAGFEKTEVLNTVRVEGTHKPGQGALLTRALAGQDINLRGLSAAAIGQKFVAYLALDSVEDAKKAMGILKKI